MRYYAFEDLLAQKGVELTKEQVLSYARDKHNRRQLLTSLIDYYLGNQNILQKVSTDTSMPNNRIVSNFCAVVVDFYTTYLLGRPIQYKSSNPDLLDKLRDIMEYNDAHETDMENNQAANIMGAGAEQVYIDEDGNFRFASVDYRDILFVYNNDVEKAIHSVIKYYKRSDNKETYDVELWTKDEVIRFEVNSSFAQIREVSRDPHVFGDVPFVEYPNNNWKLSSFAKILTLQDAYNTLLSSEVDDYQSFVDSFLAIYNAASTTPDEIARMKVDRVLLLDGDANAEWLVKRGDNTHIDQLKKDIIADIHKVASLPDLTDQHFASNASGVAIKYKMVGAENVAAKQERLFKKGIQRRVELLIRYLNFIENTNYDYRDVEITFNRNMIGADLEIAQLISLIGDKIPIQNLANQFSFITESDMALLRSREGVSEA